MAIKTVQIDGASFISSKDCVVLRSVGNNSVFIEMAFPFHEDTPNFYLTISEAMDLRNALDELIRVPLIEYKKEAI